MGVLASLLPGFREFRAALLSGYLWLGTLYLLFGPLVLVYDGPAEAGGLRWLIESARDELGPVSAGAVLTTLAWAVGIATQQSGFIAVRVVHLMYTWPDRSVRFLLNTAYQLRRTLGSGGGDRYQRREPAVRPPPERSQKKWKQFRYEVETVEAHLGEGTTPGWAERRLNELRRRADEAELREQVALPAGALAGVAVFAGGGDGVASPVEILFFGLGFSLLIGFAVGFVVVTTSEEVDDVRTDLNRLHAALDPDCSCVSRGPLEKDENGANTIVTVDPDEVVVMKPNSPH